MRNVFCILGMVLGGGVIIAAWALALYVGVWLLMVGGIIQLIQGCQADPIVAYDIAVGIVKFLLASAGAYLTGWIGTVLGIGIIAASGAAVK